MIALLLFFVQEADLAERLRSGGWKAVEELSARAELKPRLEALERGADPEAAWFAGALRAEIEAREHAGERRPFRVTYEAKDKPAADVLRELLARGNQSVESAQAGGPITVAFRDTPFLEALDTVCREGAFLLRRERGGGLQIEWGRLPLGPRFYGAGVGVRIESMERRTDVTFAEKPWSRLEIEFALRGDPNTRLLDQEVSLRIVAVRDDTGRSLLLAPEAVRARERQGTEILDAREVIADGVVDAPDPKAKKIALLRGVATVTVARKTQDAVFDKVLAGAPKAQEVAGVFLVLKKASREGGECAVELGLSAPGRLLHWPDFDEIALEDGEGRRLPFSRGRSATGAARAGYVLAFREEEGLGPPARLRVSLVTETFVRRVYFELKDILLKK